MTIRVRHRRAHVRAPLLDMTLEDELAIRTSGEPADVLAELHALDAELTVLQRLRLKEAMRSAARGETHGALQTLAIVREARR